MIRSVSAIVAAVLVWFAVATVGNLAVRVMIPGYTAVEAAMNFTLPMQIARLTVGLLSSLCAGAACAAIARSGRLPAWIAASLMVLLFLPVHYSVWEKFPVWYHAFFLITLAPAVLLGAAIRASRGRGRRASPPAA
jgi:hypothetical protein